MLSRISNEPLMSISNKHNYKRICQAIQSGGNSLFIFTVVKSVPHYHFKLACVALQMAVKEFFENHF